MTLRQLAVYLAARVIGLFIAAFVTSIVLIKWLITSRKKEFWFPTPETTRPSSLTDPKYGTHHVIALQNVKLHYVANGDSSKPLMLLVHGFPDFWFSWRNQLQAFSKHYWVVAVDMRGYGDSEKPKGAHNYDTHLLVQDLVQLIAALGKKDCVLVAHDWGGLVAWFLAAKHPELITKFIPLNIPHPIAFVNHLLSSPMQALRSWYVAFIQTPFIPELIVGCDNQQLLQKLAADGSLMGSANNSPVLESYIYVYSQPRAWSGPMNYYRRVFYPGSLIWESADQLRVKVPTLLIFGKRDVALDFRMAEKSRVFVEDFELELLDTMHFVHIEKPNEVNQLIAKFLGITAL